MKIAYIVPSLAAKGPVLVVKELAAQMAANGHRCTVFYFDQKPDAVDFECHTKKISATEAIDFTVFDVVHSHGMRPDKYVSKFREYGGSTRYVSTIHNYVLQDFRYEYNWFVAQFFGRLWMHSLRRHDKIVALSKDAERYYGRWFAPAKLTYAYNTRNPDLDKTINAEQLLDFKGDSVLIGVNCLLTRRKGVDLLVGVLPQLPNHKLFVAGNGPEMERLKKQAEGLGVADCCFFAGYVADAYRYLPFYDIYALPSRSEGFPLSLLEAAVYAKRCVVSDLPIVKECFSEQEVSIFHLAEPSSIVGAIDRATQDKKMGENLQRQYAEKYSPQKMYERYLEIYNEKV